MTWTNGCQVEKTRTQTGRHGDVVMEFPSVSYMEAETQLIFDYIWQKSLIHF